jgi:putative PIN family toxin of toxin-antitoxin system
MRVVMDTNVIVSALVFGGIPRQVLDLAAEGAYSFFFSAAIQSETDRILEGKFAWSSEEIHLRLRVFWNWGIQVEPEGALAVIADDPDDDRILECAVAAQAQVIVSGDRHLLRLGSFRSILIQSPREFLDSKAWETTK